MGSYITFITACCLGKGLVKACLLQLGLFTVAFSHTYRTKFFETFLSYLPFGIGVKALTFLTNQHAKFYCMSLHTANETERQMHVLSTACGPVMEQINSVCGDKNGVKLQQNCLSDMKDIFASCVSGGAADDSTFQQCLSAADTLPRAVVDAASTALKEEV